MANDYIAGPLLEVYKVTGYGGSEVETLIAKTKDAIEVSFDPTVAETMPHNATRAIQIPISDKVSVKVSGLMTTGVPALTTIGILDSSGNPATMNGFAVAALEAIRIKSYLRKGDAVPAMKWDFTNVEVKISSFKYDPKTFAEWSGEFLVNGLVKKTAGT